MHCESKPNGGIGRMGLMSRIGRISPIRGIGLTPLKTIKQPLKTSPNPLKEGDSPLMTVNKPLISMLSYMCCPVGRRVKTKYIISPRNRNGLRGIGFRYFLLLICFVNLLCSSALLIFVFIRAVNLPCSSSRSGYNGRSGARCC